MSNENMIVRSRLVIPINVNKFVQKANKRNADVIVLDLEDSIPYEEKEHARTLIPDAVQTISSLITPIYIRVNSEEDFLYKDIEKSVREGVSGIVVPKVESGHEIEKIDQWITELEKKANLAVGQFKISVLIETAKGFLDVADILKASKRIDTVSIGMEDLASDLGIILNQQTVASLNYFRLKLITVARAYHVIPLGLMGSLANYTDLDSYRKYAREAFELGFRGSSCIHPSQVEILNKSFKYNEEEINQARKIVNVFNNALAQGRASASYDGKMIDYPHYKKYQQIIDEYERVEKYERLKGNEGRC
ncbi:HpcH/HpaI aldolase/citrate lyase family protein [Oceanobacillus jeddahense]|uniref:CoA ester lyase n=1 Tax=Oceanobacillus jeddahense TaxID=1462527 RepID=A0ABY5JRP8_9BACI|nr:CoA ester lyase [Oceanobacillus jeddahense]UUI02976.1 CoA ester lyase [Oceanobacillus jeddahense]